MGIYLEEYLKFLFNAAYPGGYSEISLVLGFKP